MVPVLITTPHNSGFVPHHLLAEMLGEEVYCVETRERFLRGLFDEGDPYIDAIFYVPGAEHLGALTSRFVVDLNRDRYEEGRNGVVKLTDFNEEPLYPEDYVLTPEDEKKRLARYYDPYHAAIEAALKEGVLFFVDGHSMTPHGPAIGPDPGSPRPAITLMTNGNRWGEARDRGMHTSIPADIARTLVRLLEAHFAEILHESPSVPSEVALNVPFWAGEIIRHYSHPSYPCCRPGFGIEFNRGLYLEAGKEGFCQPIPGRIQALNEAFNAFLGDAVEVMREALGT